MEPKRDVGTAQHGPARNGAGAYRLGPAAARAISRRLGRLAAMVAGLCLLARLTAEDSSGADRFADLSIEELMNERVTIASKREQRVSEAASAVFVVTHEDLRRSGATTLWDGLRAVPGVHVAAGHSAGPSVTARGFNGFFANKLLVLMDGRAVYTPLFGGVYWYLQQPMLEDLDQIEIVRGPGASMWGANAVNGVINIKSRDARQTPGGLVYAGGGDLHRAMGGLRYGGRAGEKTFYRVYASGELNDGFETRPGQRVDEGWESRQGGVRIDHFADDRTTFTWQAGISDLDARQYASAREVNALARWARRDSATAGLEAQAYVGRTKVVSPEFVTTEGDVLDLSLQQTTEAGARNRLVWGVGERLTANRFTEAGLVAEILKSEVRGHVFNTFVQDEYEALSDRLFLTAGMKIENSSYIGWELQPTLRALFKANAQTTVWTAVSRAVRSPTECEGQGFLAVPAGQPVPGPDGRWYLPRAIGSTDADAEILWAYEAGYRLTPRSNISMDAAVFYNDYTDMIAPAGGQVVPAFPISLVNFYARNISAAQSYGGEVAVTIALTNRWRVAGSYSRLVLHVQEPAPAAPGFLTSDDPGHYATLRSSFDFSHRTSFDVQVRHSGRIRAIPGFTTADVRLAFRPIQRLELALVGQNLFDGAHPEHPAAARHDGLVETEVPRSVYGKVSWTF